MKGTSVKTRGLLRNPLSNMGREMRTPYNSYCKEWAVGMEKICSIVRSRAARTWQLTERTRRENQIFSLNNSLDGLLSNVCLPL